MEGQQRKYSCGPASVRSALYMLGRKVREATIRRVAGTTTMGTDENGIIRAIRHYGFKTTPIHSKSKREAWAKLKHQIAKGRPVILCVNDWNHWVTAVGTFGNKIIIFDPYRVPGKQKNYSGLTPMNEKDIMSMWGYEDKEENTPLSFYAIIVRN